MNSLANAIELLTIACHGAAYNAGWWRTPANVMFCDYRDEVRKRTRFGIALTAEKIALVHSEVSESLEGVRKNGNDDHLPHRKSVEVELADALIRIFDLAGAMQLDLGGALVEKMAYNAVRADHTRLNRAAEGGKAF